MSVPPPLPSQPSPPCPNCGLPWPPDAPVCPNCGYVRPEIPSWPPSPGGQPGLSAPTPAKLVTGNAAGDIFLGLGISLASFSVGIGIVVMPILYFVLRRQSPVLARGLGFGWLAGTALVLGALALCIAGLSQSSQNGGYRADLSELRRVYRSERPPVSELRRRAVDDLAPASEARGTTGHLAPEAPADGTKMVGRFIGRWAFLAVDVRTG